MVSKHASQVFFDKTAFVKIKISNNLKQNIEETDSKQPKIHSKIHMYQPGDREPKTQLG
jgi:hypothetical protein